MERFVKELAKRIFSSINAAGGAGITLGTFDLAGFSEWGRVTLISVGMVVVLLGEAMKYKYGKRQPIIE